MQTLYKDEAITIAPNQDGDFLSDFQNTLGDLADGFWFQRCATLYRHVDVRYRKFFSPHHVTSPNGMSGREPPREITYHFVSVLPESSGLRGLTMTAITSGICDQRNGVLTHIAQQQSRAADVADGSKADIGLALVDVRFTPKRWGNRPAACG
jgi:hypothetical protein